MQAKQRKRLGAEVQCTVSTKHSNAWMVILAAGPTSLVVRLVHPCLQNTAQLHLQTRLHRRRP